MRKMDFALLVSLSALGAYFWHPRPTPSTPPPTASPRLTASGRWEVLKASIEVAGLRIGASQADIVQVLGQPDEKHQQNSENHQWIYASDGGQLVLALLEGRLVAAAAMGRWSLSQDGRPLPAFTATQAEVQRSLGPPTRSETRADGLSSWIYSLRPGELTYTFEQGSVSQFSLTGEIKPTGGPSPP